MSLESFFYQHPVFRLDQLIFFKEEQGAAKKNHIQQTLQYYLRKKRIVSIRRGLFAVVPPNQSPDTVYLDPYSIAATVTPDSVLSYHTALELHGLSYSLFQRQTFKTGHKVKPFEYKENLFQPVVQKKCTQDLDWIKDFTTVVNRNGMDITLTNLASTYVDVLDRPDLCGGWEEVYRCLGESVIPSSQEVIRYCLGFDSPVLCAKVGYFLEQETGPLSVDSASLGPLLAQRPKSPYYLAGNIGEPCVYIKKWNLMAPKSHMSRTWEEPNYDI